MIDGMPSGIATRRLRTSSLSRMATMRAGLADLVRIRNGEVCYWPNHGYGRFGAKVTMDNAPWFDASDSFDPKRVRLADIDGGALIAVPVAVSDGDEQGHDLCLPFASGSGPSMAQFGPGVSRPARQSSGGRP